MEIWDAGDNYDDANKIENGIKICVTIQHACYIILSSSRLRTSDVRMAGMAAWLEENFVISTLLTNIFKVCLGRLNTW